MTQKKKHEPKKKLNGIEHLAVFLEKSRLADYMDLIQRPHRLAWLNFWAGIWRGFGFALGGLVLLAAMAWGLKHLVHHLGGLPWFGDQMKDAVTWLLNVIDKRKSGS